MPVLTSWESAGSDLTLGEPQSPSRGKWLPLNVTSAWDSIQKTSQVENNSKTNAPQQFHSQPTLGMTTRVLLVIVYYYYHYYYYCNRTNPGPQSSGELTSFSPRRDLLYVHPILQGGVGRCPRQDRPQQTPSKRALSNAILPPSPHGGNSLLKKRKSPIPDVLQGAAG